MPESEYRTSKTLRRFGSSRFGNRRYHRTMHRLIRPPCRNASSSWQKLFVLWCVACPDQGRHRFLPWLCHCSTYSNQSPLVATFVKVQIFCNMKYSFEKNMKASASLFYWECAIVWGFRSCISDRSLPQPSLLIFLCVAPSVSLLCRPPRLSFVSSSVSSLLCRILVSVLCLSPRHPFGIAFSFLSYVFL